MSRVRKPTPRSFNPPRTCGGKYCYNNRQDAELVIAEKEILQPELQLTTYYCAVCRSWHLTRVKDDIRYR
ncbi:MAG: hypothetical protein ACM3MA_00960 [Acidobacteriota bacterium]